MTGSVRFMGHNEKVCENCKPLTSIEFYKILIFTALNSKVESCEARARDLIDKFLLWCSRTWEN